MMSMQTPLVQRSARARGEAPAAISGIHHIDHITYVAGPDDEAEFLSHWAMLGFHELVRLETTRFPAAHIALVHGSAGGQPWSMMTGLSVSQDPRSPINEYVRRYGRGIQHVAYSLDPDADMERLREQMAMSGWTFMTSVLTYRDAAGAKLKQMFGAPSVPYGPFVEFAQRFPGPDGLPFDGFDTRNIDDLYEQYADYSAWLARKA